MIESVRKYWNRRPCNVKHSLVSVDEFPLIYSFQVRQRKYIVEPHIISFAEFERWRGKRVLDVGCGIGTESLGFAAHGAHVTVVDISEESLAIARKRACAEGESITFIQGDMEHLDECLSDQKFDLIWSFGAIHHTPNPLTALKQIRPYLDEMGVLKAMVYHRNSWRVAEILATQWRPWRSIENTIAQYSEAQTGCPVTYTYTKDSARTLFRRAGFYVFDVHPDHIFPYQVQDYIEHLYVKKWYWKIMPSRMYDWIRTNYGWHLLITAGRR